MSKWKIPRHRPRKAERWMMEDINHGKRFKRMELARIARERSRKREEYARYKELADCGVEAARFVLGSCVRKKSMPLHVAKRCAMSAAMETGRRMFVYECPFCGAFHLTSHPDGRIRYVHSTGGKA